MNTSECMFVCVCLNHFKINPCIDGYQHMILSGLSNATVALPPVQNMLSNVSDP